MRIDPSPASRTMPRPDFPERHRIPIWVVITGNLRSGREFRRTIAQALELRASGRVDGIRFVTWKGELDQAPGLERALVDSGISILTVEPPPADPKSHPLFHGYVHHQRKALHFGLRSLPSDCFVLKTRTDFAEERFDSLVATLFRDPPLELEVTIPSPILRTRLFSYDARPDYLFYWDDIVFSGMRDDLIRLNNFDIACDFIHPGHVCPAESRLFAPLFLRHYPVLEWFFENVRGEEFSRILQQWFSSGEVLPLPALIRDVLASYFHVVSRYVVLPTAETVSEAPVSLKSFFTADSTLGIKAFSHPWASHKLVTQELSDRLRGPGDFADGNLTAIVSAMRRMDADPGCRGALPPAMERSQREYEDFARQLGCGPLVSQASLTSAADPVAHRQKDPLGLVEMPEKRHLSWLQQKKLGARRTAANWLLRKLL